MKSADPTVLDRLMFEAPARRLLWRLSLPIYLSSLAWVVYTLTDIYWISRIDPADPAIVGGVSLIIPIYMLAYALSNGLLMGVKSLVARAVGANEAALLDRVASSGLVLAALAAGLFLFVGYAFADSIVQGLGATGALFRPAHDFLLYVLPAVALLFAFNVLSGIAQGEGRMQAVMHAMGIGVGLNLLLDPLFILGLGMGVKGAALATCIAQALSLLWLVGVFARGGMRVPLRLHPLGARRATMARILQVGLPQGLAEILVAVYLFGVNGLVVRIDPLAITAFGLCARVDQVLLLSVAALSAAVLTATAQNAARGEQARVRQIQEAAVLWGAGVVFAQALLLIALAPAIYPLMSDSAEVVDYAVTQTRWVNLFYIFAVPTLVVHAFFLAVGQPWPAVAIQFAKMFLVALPLMWALHALLGWQMPAVWLGIIASEVVAAMAAWIWWQRMQNALEQGRLAVL